MNPNSLAVAAARVSRFAPELYRRNVLGGLQLPGEKFHSISVNYLLHCLPGALPEKSQAIVNLLPYLHDDGVMFGSTILGEGVPINPLARRVMSLYNRKGIFCNRADSLADLSAVLQRHFRQLDIEVHGCVAVFCARR